MQPGVQVIAVGYSGGSDVTQCGFSTIAVTMSNATYRHIAAFRCRDDSLVDCLQIRRPRRFVLATLC